MCQYHANSFTIVTCAEMFGVCANLSGFGCEAMNIDISDDIINTSTSGHLFCLLEMIQVESLPPVSLVVRYTFKGFTCALVVHCFDTDVDASAEQNGFLLFTCKLFNDLLVLSLTKSHSRTNASYLASIIFITTVR